MTPKQEKNSTGGFFCFVCFFGTRVCVYAFVYFCIFLFLNHTESEEQHSSTAKKSRSQADVFTSGLYIAVLNFFCFH